MKRHLITLLHDLTELGKQLLYDAGLGPAPWAHLQMIDAIEFDDGDISVLIYKKSRHCGEPGEFLIDMRHRDFGFRTFSLLDSPDLDEILKVLNEAKQTIDLYIGDDLL